MTRLAPLFTAAALLIATSLAAAQTLQPPFDTAYSWHDLGPVAGVPTSYGGIGFHPLYPNRLLIGGAANTPAGAVYWTQVQRDGQGHITGFIGNATLWSTAPGIDGGLVIGPGNMLFYTAFPGNQLGQIPFGQTAPSKVIDLTPLGVSPSVGALQIVPAGHVDAGKLKLASFNSGTWHTSATTPDSAGTYDVNSVTQGPFIGGGPEGIAYPPAGSPFLSGFSAVLVTEYAGGSIAVYSLHNGDPLPASRRTFLSGLSGAQGATIDPVTGDFLFVTFGPTDRVIAVRGFGAPTCNGGAAAYGTATVGSGGLAPFLWVDGMPCVGNALSSLNLTNGLGGALAVLFNGNQPMGMPLPAYGGTLYALPQVVNVIVIGGAQGVAGAGSISVPITIPNDPLLSGQSAYLQAVLIDPGAIKGVAFSRGLQITIG